MIKKASIRQGGWEGRSPSAMVQSRWFSYGCCHDNLREDERYEGVGITVRMCFEYDQSLASIVA